jgi:hypothetical protein
MDLDGKRGNFFLKMARVGKEEEGEYRKMSMLGREEDELM